MKIKPRICIPTTGVIAAVATMPKPSITTLACSTASAIPLIYRSKQAVIIGDPLQLKHITKINTTSKSNFKAVISLHSNFEFFIQDPAFVQKR